MLGLRADTDTLFVLANTVQYITVHKQDHVEIKDQERVTFTIRTEGIYHILPTQYSSVVRINLPLPTHKWFWK